MKNEILRVLCSVIRTDVVRESSSGELTACFDSTNDSPLMHSRALREILRAEAERGKTLYTDEHACYFAALRAEDGFLFLGPMCHEKLGRVAARQMVRSYGADAEDMRTLPVFTLPEIRNIVLLAASTAGISSEEAGFLSGLPEEAGGEDAHDRQRFLLKEEEENDDSSYRHSYHEEQLLMQAIREGRASDAVRIAENMDHDAGRLSENYIRHRRNLAIVGLALCARDAIEGGIPPEAGYRISGYYIGKLDAVQDASMMLKLRNQGIRELAERVKEKLSRPGSSHYVERAADYIRKHYREKIYLSDVAENLGISEGYLSRLFRQETGGCFQDQINAERVARASNLLLYSDFSLSQIAEYVNFPNQSYFGKIFRKYKGMTPKTFRDRYRNREFFS